MIFDLIVIAFFVFKLPSLTWLAAFFCLVRHIVRDRNPELKARKKREWQKAQAYFDIWQDNQGF